MTRGILFDISAAINQRAGVGRYARELTRRLIPLFDESSVGLWYAADPEPFDEGLVDRPPWCGLPTRRALISRSNVDRLLFRQNLPIYPLLRLGRPDLIYSPDFTAPMLGHAHTHITVHDLAWFHPEAKTPAPLANFLAPVVERSVQAAAAVFTVSETIRQEIIDRYHMSDDRVVVAPNAAADRFFAAQPLSDDQLGSLGLRHPFVFAVGTVEPRKNLATLFRALQRLSPSIQLGLSGSAGWIAKSILDEIDTLKLSGRVLHFGFMTDELLARVVASADVVVYPSTYEGFGLPIIEALATGTPVIASDLPVFHEVGSEVVAYFDPDDADELAAAIERVLAQGTTDAQERARIEQARRFDWQTSAEIVARRLQDVY